MTQRKIYLSGPMTGYPGFNHGLFNTVARQLRGAGHEVFNPAEAFPDTEAFDARKAFAIYSRHICLTADTLVLLPGWEASRGACVERGLAEVCGLNIVHFADFGLLTPAHL